MLGQPNEAMGQSRRLRRSRFAVDRDIRWLLLLAALAMGVVVGACGGKDLPNDAVAFTPAAAYQRWWQMTEACSGLNGAFDLVHWFKAPASSILAREGGGTIAYWVSTGNRILLANGPRGDLRAVLRARRAVPVSGGEYARQDGVRAGRRQHRLRPREPPDDDVAPLRRTARRRALVHRIDLQHPAAEPAQAYDMDP
jgi:hypothetical protein